MLGEEEVRQMEDRYGRRLLPIGIEKELKGGGWPDSEEFQAGFLYGFRAALRMVLEEDDILPGYPGRELGL